MEDESQNFVGRVAQKAIITREDKVLLMRNAGRETWELPGGRLHTGEEPTAGLKRELQEELGVSVIVSSPVFTGTFTLSRTNELHFFVIYACELAEPSAEFTVDDSEVEEVRWFSKEEISALSIWENYRNGLEVFFKMREN